MTEQLPKVPVETTSIKTKRPKSSSPIVKALVGLLILVILSEVIYLVYNNYFKPNTLSLSGPTIQQKEALTEDLKDTPSDSDIEQKTESTSTSNVNNVDLQIIRYFNRLMDNPNLSYKNASISFTIEAEINGFNNELTHYAETKFPLTISLKHENEILHFYFSQREYISTKVIDQNDPDKKLNLIDLRAGDKILFTETTNLIGTNFSSKFVITIIE